MTDGDSWDACFEAGGPAMAVLGLCLVRIGKGEGVGGQLYEGDGGTSTLCSGHHDERGSDGDDIE